MAYIGLVGEFDESKEEFCFYVERLEGFFKANHIKDEDKVSVFLAVIGPKTYKLLRNVLQPELPHSKSLNTLVEALKSHFKPAPNEIAERLRFYKRNQHNGETLSDYIVGLKALASTCSFGTFLDDAMRDRLVHGMNSEAIRRILVNKRGLTFQDACETALATEMVDRDLADFKASGSVNNLHKIQRSSSNQEVAKFKNGNNVKPSTCFRCGARHSPSTCKYIQAKCHKCSKIGHIAPVCRSKTKFDKSKQKQSDARYVQAESEPEQDEEVSTLYGIALHGKDKSKDYQIRVHIFDVPIVMELDTAADVSTVGEIWFKKNCSNQELQPSSLKLKCYNGESIAVLGQIDADVEYEGQSVSLPLIVVKGDKPPLFGKNWIRQITVNWKEIFSICGTRSVQSILDMFSVLFQPNRKPIQHFKADVTIHNATRPVFIKARPVPYALKNAVETEIQKSEKLGIWHRVEHSKWATPVVIVPKNDGNVRICGDFKVTLNPVIDVEKYPLPTQQDLFATLSGGQYYSKLDLSGAYQQVELEENAQELLTLNTHVGLIRPTRLLYGIASASAVFQSVIERILSGLKSVIAFQDDILVTGATESEHLQNLEKVFMRLKKYNVKLNRDKCKFLQQTVEYLGHRISADGIHPTTEKVDAIRNVASPKNVTELRAFLGLLNYYGKFLKDTATLLAPLHNLLTIKKTWDWNCECEETFKKCKELLTSDAVLVHYDSKLPLRLSCDASPVGLGVVLSHVVNNVEKPIAYASRSLSKAESNYSQVEKEALSIIFGIKKFQQYLYGREFSLVTDHQPLLSIFGPKKGVPVLAAARLQRWALILSNYKYTIEYRKGSLHQNADALSRLPYDDDTYELESGIYKTSYVHELPVTAADIMKATRVDPVLGRVYNYIQQGWPSKVPEDVRPYSSRRDELAVESGCVLWGRRVIIPSKLHKTMLELLHDVHPGMVKMKGIARSYFWWPCLDRDIEDLSRSCQACQITQRDPPTAPLQSWIWPKGPMDRIHIDFAQKGKDYFLICIDAHSKWIEVSHMSSTTTAKTIEELRQLFARYGLPLELVSDNGPQLRAEEFKQFLASNGVKHTLVPTYHPSSNGAAERAVQVFKNALEKMRCDIHDNTTLQCRISRFLFSYRTTPHATTGLSPAELFTGRELRTRLSLIRPNLSSTITNNQMKQKLGHDHGNTVPRSFSIGQQVYVREFALGKPRWTKGIILSIQSSRTYCVNVEGHQRIVHMDQIRKNLAPDDLMPIVPNQMEPVNDFLPIVSDNIEPVKDFENSTPVNTPVYCGTNDIVPVPIEDTGVKKNCQKPGTESATHSKSEGSKNNINVPPRRQNPQRSRKAPDRLNLKVFARKTLEGK